MHVDNQPSPAPPTPTFPPEAAGPARRGWFRHRMTALGWPIGAISAVVVAWFFVFGLPPPVLRLWASLNNTDGGSIFVHGPQVYTRERLVNDRYQEDSWLNGMLDQSPREVFGYSGTRGAAESSRRSAEIELSAGTSAPTAASAPETASQTKAPEAASVAQGLPDIAAQPTFKLQATRAYREQIRTMLIENQLDDRHDLHGNTLYRLRFDATILPNEGSQAAAQIKIRIEPPKNYALKSIRQGTASFEELTKWLETWQDLYARWRTSLELRLEEESLARVRAYEIGRFNPDDYELLLTRLRDDVLRITKSIEDGPPDIVKNVAKSAPNAAVMVCFQNAFQRAGNTLSALRKREKFPAIGKPEPMDVDPKILNEYRQAVLLGMQTTITPIEMLQAHEQYRNRIRNLLNLRQELALEIANINSCDEKYFQEVKLLSSAQVPGMAQVSDGGGQLLGYGVRREPIQFIDTIQLRRRLLDAVFWPRLYKAVTGVDEPIDRVEDARLSGTPQLSQPQSLTRFATVDWEPDRLRRVFRVKPRTDVIVVAKKRECLEVATTEPLERFRLNDEDLFIAQSTADSLRAEAPELNLQAVIESAKQALDRRQADAEQLHEQYKRVKQDSCDFLRVPVEVQTGLFNFAMRLSLAQEVFTYAISPAEPDELVANRIRTDWVRDFRLRGRLTGSAPASSSVAAQEELNELLRFDTSQRSVFGFGERFPIKDDPNAHRALFGWQVLPRDQAQAGEPLGRRQLTPTQIPMTALVSLPAWWPHIGLVVTRAWVDGQNKLKEVGEPTSYTIDLPTNYETLDASLFGNPDSGPVLIDWQIPRLAVRPCQSFAITLIGRRLWRSTVVTLGSDRASRVIVMPNMNGIIAIFEKAPRPGNLPRQEGAGKAPRYYAPLTIWTSQGHTQLPRLIEFELSAEPPPAFPDSQGCPKPAADASPLEQRRP